MSDTLTIFLIIFLSVNFSVILTFGLYKYCTYRKSVKKQDRVNHFGDSAEKKVEGYIKKHLKGYLPLRCFKIIF